MATAVAIAIRKEAVLDRLTAAIQGLNDTAGTDVAERPTQVHPDLREVVLLEWVTEAIEHLPAAIGKATDASTAKAEAITKDRDALKTQLDAVSAVLTDEQKTALADAEKAKADEAAKAAAKKAKP